MTPSSAAQAMPAAPAHGVLSPLSIHGVQIDPSGFWGHRQELNASAIIAHCEYWMGKVGWLANFDAAAEGRLPEARHGREFSDADVYKLVEAMCWEHGRTGDPSLEASIRSIVSRIGRAQESDGYLNTNFGRPGQGARYSDMEWGRELYNYGHLLQAAVARARTGERDELFEIALRVADHVCHEFGVDGRDTVCGHPEIEVGLTEFARVTGDRKYRDQAALFIERRGHGLLEDIEWGRSYFQDDMPVRDAEVFRGHAVRALYLAAAAVDVAVDTQDSELFAAVERQWRNTVAKRTYVTGGVGSHHQDEAFGHDYELPTDRAYCETCAGVASIMVSWRLLLATGEARYGDMIERVLYNIVATSPAEDGKSFFYSNTLHQRTPGEVPDPDVQIPRASSSLRAPWFAVSCCPPNVSRTLATLGALIATTTEGGIQIHQYAASGIKAGGIELAVTTSYPDSGEVSIEVLESPGRFELALRIPAWAEGATVTHAGEVVSAEPGTFRFTADFAVGDIVTLDLPVAPRFTFPNGRIDAVRGTVTVERGPLVHCLESVDLPSGVGVDDVIVDTASGLADGDGKVTLTGWVDTNATGTWPYGARRIADRTQPVSIPLVPYHSWANRGAGTMRVWVRSAED